jgi:histidyl-tRNA synthetase
MIGVSEFPSWRDMEIIQLIMKVWEEMGMESQLEYNRREIMMSTHTLANYFRRRRGFTLLHNHHRQLN